MMELHSALGNLLQLLKNLCFNIVTVLTVLVAVSNELQRMNIRLQWVDERSRELRLAWWWSIAIHAGLSVLYGLVEHRIDALVLDLVTLAAMIIGVEYLRRRGSQRAAQADDPDDEDGDRIPRRPLHRQERPERVPRRRRRPL